jgi:hypothetical protein
LSGFCLEFVERSLFSREGGLRDRFDLPDFTSAFAGCKRWLDWRLNLRAPPPQTIVQMATCFILRPTFSP